jgi:hypothetical protein
MVVQSIRPGHERTRRIEVTEYRRVDRDHRRVAGEGQRVGRPLEPPAENAALYIDSVEPDSETPATKESSVQAGTQSRSFRQQQRKKRTGQHIEPRVEQCAVGGADLRYLPQTDIGSSHVVKLPPVCPVVRGPTLCRGLPVQPATK